MKLFLPGRRARQAIRIGYKRLSADTLDSRTWSLPDPLYYWVTPENKGAMTAFAKGHGDFRYRVLNLVAVDPSAKSRTLCGFKS